ncbi:MAG: YncE family protein, partial [Pseudonocardiaceae bacterium]
MQNAIGTSGANNQLPGDDAEVSGQECLTTSSPPTGKEVGVLGAPRAALPTALLVAGLLAGCAVEGGSGATHAGLPAVPASAPVGGPAPAGTVVPLGAPATEVVVDPRTETVAVALDDPPRLLLRTLDGAAPPRQVPLPGPAADLVLAAEGGPLLVPVTAPGSLIRVPLDGGAPSGTGLGGSARGAVAVGGVTVVALGDRLAVLVGNSKPVSIPGFSDATRLVPAGAPNGSKIWVLDRGRSAVSVVDVSSGVISPALRAGNGAADAVADRFARMLVTDARDGELLAFADDPPVLRQRFPLPGAPWALAYDGRRDLAWVTLTARDEVVGLGVAAGEPVIVHRFRTVHEPNSVAVDPVSGRVLV